VIGRRGVWGAVPALVAVALLSACSGGGDGDDDGGSEATLQPPTTAEPATPDDRFRAAVKEAEIPMLGSEALGVAVQTCTTLASSRGDADFETQMLDLAFRGNADPADIATLLRLAGEHICPKFQPRIEAYLDSRGR
jgi:Protein of unknown function (DUF732)